MNKNENKYGIATISQEDIDVITALEDNICERTNKKIVLIAYEEKDTVNNFSI